MTITSTAKRENSAMGDTVTDEQDGKADSFTAALWAVSTDDEKWTEYLRVRAALTACQEEQAAIIETLNCYTVMPPDGTVIHRVSVALQTMHTALCRETLQEQRAIEAEAELTTLREEIARLKRYIATFPARPWLETDHPDVIDCMGSAPACAENGCQFDRVREERDRLVRQAVLVDTPEKWMKWCDHRILERAEAAESSLTTLRARVQEIVQENSLLKAIDAVERIDYCDCGRPKSEHKYWVDRVYDYNGYSCPGSVTGSEYRFSEATTSRKHFEARAKIVSDALSSLTTTGTEK